MCNIFIAWGYCTCLDIWVVWRCIFVYECAKIGHFGWSDIDILQCRYRWSSKWHHKKDNNQPKWSIAILPPSGFALSLSMVTSVMDLDLGAAAPYGSEAFTGRLVHSRHCRFCQLEQRNRTDKKNREIRRALALVGRCLMMSNNNQPYSRWKR